MKGILIIVGGFLGAGKTSLLGAMAKRLQTAGEKVGVITNDQAAGLVDTEILQASAGLVQEVSGSCFCCNFNAFANAIGYICQQNDGGIILAEPVGSCTDLSATLVQPLKENFAAHITVKPLTVVADPTRLRALLDKANTTAYYIIAKQFEEADIILINKSDCLTVEALTHLQAEAADKWPNAKILTASVKTGAGLTEWLATVMQAQTAGNTVAEVDYDLYADEEAAFGWLNATFSLAMQDDYEALANDFLQALAVRFDAISAQVGHVKFLLQDTQNLIIGNIIGSRETATLRKLRKKSEKTVLTINARVAIPPQSLELLVLEEMEKTFGAMGYTQTALNCLTPGRPNPTYRYTSVVNA